MPGKTNPSQCEALSMVAIQVIANDAAVTFGGAAGHLEMNAYKPLLIHNIVHSVRIVTDVCRNFRLFLVEGLEPNTKRITQFLDQSLMLVTALNPIIGYEKASEVAHYALENDLTLKEAVLELNYMSAAEFDRVVDPVQMVHPGLAVQKRKDD